MSALTRTSSIGVRRLNANLEATEHALARSEDRYIRFFREHEGVFQWMISRYYPLSPYLLANYSDEWDWMSISRNESIDWSNTLIRDFGDQLDWGCLSENESLPWSKSFIRKYQQRWAWWILSSNEALPWDEELIREHFDRWEWSGTNSVWGNNGIKWTKPLIEGVISGPVSVNEEGLARNRAVDWTPAFAKWLLQKPELIILSPGKMLGLLSSRDKLGFDPDMLVRLYATDRDCSLRRARSATQTDAELWRTLSYNSDLAWTRDLIEAHEQRWFWRQLSLNSGLPWTADMLDTYRRRWDWGWHGLSRNPALPWSQRLIEQYSPRWNWFWLSRNPGLPWSQSFIETNKEKLNWAGLSENEALPWSESLISEYERRWDWQGGGDGGTKLDDSTGSVCRTINGQEIRRSTAGLTDNKSLPWSISLLDQHFEKWGKMNEDTLKIIWMTEFESRVDDEMVEKILHQIS